MTEWKTSSNLVTAHGDVEVRKQNRETKPDRKLTKNISSIQNFL